MDGWRAPNNIAIPIDGGYEIFIFLISSLAVFLKFLRDTFRYFFHSRLLG
jgi:hypothetical protein